MESGLVPRLAPLRCEEGSVVSHRPLVVLRAARGSVLLGAGDDRAQRPVAGPPIRRHVAPVADHDGLILVEVGSCERPLGKTVDANVQRVLAAPSRGCVPRGRLTNTVVAVVRGVRNRPDDLVGQRRGGHGHLDDLGETVVAGFVLGVVPGPGRLAVRVHAPSTGRRPVGDGESLRQSRQQWAGIRRCSRRRSTSVAHQRWHLGSSGT